MTNTKPALLLALLIASVPAHAQTSHTPPSSRTGPLVSAIDLAGRESTGRLVRWTGSTIVIGTGSAERTYLQSELARVDVRSDSLRNGFLFGAAFGSLGGLITDCPNGRRSCGPTRVAFTLLGMATWGAIGAGIDALIPGRTPLWRAAP